MVFDCFEILPVGAAPGGECFLILTDSVTILCDSGFHFCAEQLVETLRRALGGRPLDYILLTHSHYDHVLGSIHCKRAWPDSTVVAEEYAAAIFQKPTARQLMRRLDASHAAFCGCAGYEDRIDELHADRVVRDGDLLQLGAYRVRVLSLPGHTKDCIGFYFEDEQFLLAPESLGLPTPGGAIIPGFLSSYGATIRSMERARTLPLRGMLLSHFGFLDEAQSRDFLPRSQRWCETCKDLLLNALARGEDEAAIAQEKLTRFFPDGLPDYYPRMAFEVNTHAQIETLRREFPA